MSMVRSNPSLQKSLGDFYRSKATYEKAILNYQQVLVIYKKEGDRKGEAETLVAIGSTYDRSLSQYDKAITFYQEALLVYQQLKDYENQLSTIMNLISCHKHLGQFNKAASYGDQLLSLFQHVKNVDDLGWLYQDMGLFAQRASNYRTHLTSLGSLN
jgi:tetratricopeptide (TPR) repeat protein